MTLLFSRNHLHGPRGGRPVLRVRRQLLEEAAPAGVLAAAGHLRRGRGQEQVRHEVPVRAQAGAQAEGAQDVREPDPGVIEQRQGFEGGRMGDERFET